MQTDLIIIGGGAAGLIAAGAAARRGLRVLLLEKNSRAGRKVLITGKGRCNVTNCCLVQDFMENIAVNKKFLYSALNNFTPYDAMGLFEEMGVPLKVERGERVFPVSDKAVDVVDALVRYAKQPSVEIRFEQTVHHLLIGANGVEGVCTESGEKYGAPNVMICTGGKSYPGTGSTGDGYRFAKQAGHSVISPVPSLIPLVVREKLCRDAQGLSLKNVTLSAVDTKTDKVIYKELGEMLFTHFGVSGPLVLSSSSHMREISPGRYKLLIDLKPGLDMIQLDQRIQRDFAKYINKDFINSLADLLPRKLIGPIVKLSGIPGDRKINQITKAERQTLCSVIKGLELTVDAFRPIEEAIITSGGVNVKEVNPKTMESKFVRGLYFAGEVLDVDAYTGGYNLQIAYATAMCAANAVQKNIQVEEQE